MQAALNSVDALQISLARAYLFQQELRDGYDKADGIMMANRTQNDAFMLADVRAVVAQARLEKDKPIDPVLAYVGSQYEAKVQARREG